MDTCQTCNGTGEISTDVWDEDSHEYQRGVGTEKCPDCSSEPDYE